MCQLVGASELTVTSRSTVAAGTYPPKSIIGTCVSYSYSEPDSDTMPVRCSIQPGIRLIVTSPERFG